jgi:tRNA G26 N,N-dimethylase Trm1
MSQNNNNSSVTSTTLLIDGKSTRLRDMRDKAMGKPMSAGTQAINEAAMIKKLDKVVMADLLRAREIIDKKLESILSNYPVNKQVKLFKIRFGISINQLKELSIKDINLVLGIKQKVVTIIDLDYFGRSVEE